MSDLLVARLLALYGLVMVSTFAVSFVWDRLWWVSWVGWTPFFVFVAAAFFATVGLGVVDGVRYLVTGETREQRGR